MTEKKNTLEFMLKSKRELLRMFVLATVLAFSVGVLASLAAAQTMYLARYVVGGCVLLTLLALAVLAADLRNILAFEDRLEGFIFLDPTKNEPIRVEGYELSRHLCKVLAAVKAESRSIYSEWDTDPLVKKKQKPPQRPHRESTGDEKTQGKPNYIGIFKVLVDKSESAAPKAARLLEEALLFTLLEELSLHLSTYFQGSTDSDELQELEREHIPSFLLQNRVLNLLTTPIEQRDIFLTAFPNKDKRPDGELHSLVGSDGAMYSRFDLVLPSGSRVKHRDDGGVLIETQRIELEMHGRYTGTTGVVSRAFANYYMQEEWEDVECKKVEIILRGRIKPLALLSSKKWEHYRWLDSFRSRLRSRVDFNTFQVEAHWPIIQPMLYSFRGHFSSLRRDISQLRTSRDES